MTEIVLFLALLFGAVSATSTNQVQTNDVQQGSDTGV